MSTDILKFGLSTRTVLIRSELPAVEVMDLILLHAPDVREAAEAIDMMWEGYVGSGRYDGIDWSVWFVRKRHTLH